MKGVERDERRGVGEGGRGGGEQIGGRLRWKAGGKVHERGETER